MSHTYWDPKGMVKKRPGGYTYHGGNTHLSTQYKERYIPKYDPSSTLSQTDGTDTLNGYKKSCEWNTYQKKMWYQDCLDHTKEEYENFPGIHAEWRKEGEFEKSYRQYNSKFVYDFRVNVTSTDANGVESREQLRTSDHTEIQKLRRDMNEKDRYDIKSKKTVDFNDLESPPKPSLSRDNSNTSELDIKYFNKDNSMRRSGSSGGPRRHPAINPSLCSEHPRETFRKKEQFPLFWSETQKEDFRQHRSSSNLLDTSTGRTANEFSASKTRKNEHMYPYSSRPMTTQQITLRSQGSASNRPLNTTGLKGTSRRPQSGYERGLAGTLQKNDGWRDESLLSNAGKISFYPLSFDVLETLSFAPAKTASGSVQKKPMSDKRANMVGKVFDALTELSNSYDSASIQVITSSFSSVAHPAVVSKRVSESDVHESFILDLYRLSQYEVHGHVFNVFEHYPESDLLADVFSGEKDFEVKKDVFFGIYDAYSQGISNDGYFEQLVTRSWLSLGLLSNPSKEKIFLSSSYKRRMNSSIDLLK